MKIDIEGSELEVLTDLIITGALQHINFTFAEFHPHLFSDDKRSQKLKDIKFITQWLTDTSEELNLLNKINVSTIDDESFHTSDFPLPSCKNS